MWRLQDDSDLVTKKGLGVQHKINQGPWCALRYSFLLFLIIFGGHQIFRQTYGHPRPRITTNDGH